MHDDGLEIRSLFVSSIAPWPETSGNRRRMSSVLRGLRTLGPVDAFLLSDSVPEPPDGSGVRDVSNGPAPRISTNTLDQISWLATRTQRPSELVGLDPSPTVESLRRWVAEGDRAYDLVWCNRPVSYLAVAAALTSPVIVDLDDLEDRKLADRLRTDVQVAGIWGGPRVPGWQRLARYKLRRNAAGWRRLQRRIAGESAAVVVCSDEDRERSALPNAIVVPNCYSVPSEPLGRGRPDGAPTFLLIGLMRYRPNADGAAWFVHEIWPRVRETHPTAELRIVGEAADQVRALGDLPGVTVTGRVASVDDELRRADVSVVPIRFGGGTRLKVLESWAHRIPVVSTTRGAAGLGASHGEHLLIADDAASFADACIRMLGEPSLRDRIVEAGAALHEARFTCDVVEARMAADVRRLIGSGRD